MALQHHREIGVKYGNVTTRILREFYGSFAPHCANNEKLSDVISKLDVCSLTQLVRDYNSGKLKRICLGAP
jgi:hypothetical protein